MEKLGAFTCLTILFAFAHLVYSQDCVHIIHLKTGDKVDGGTDAKVSLKLYDSDGNSVVDNNLWNRGVMEAYHDYFERNNLDIFSIKSKCLASKVCKIVLSQDNVVRRAGWYIEYLKVSTDDFHSTDVCSINEFQINQWLSEDDPPYALSLTRDLCNSIDNNQNSSHFNITNTI